MSRAWLKLSRARWARRLKSRKAALTRAREEGHAGSNVVTDEEAARIKKWIRRVDEAERMIARRDTELNATSVAAPVRPLISSSWGWHPGVHDGVDLITEGDDVIYALCDAEVIDVRSSGWWGKGAQPSSGHPVSDGDGIIQLKCCTDVGPFAKGLHFGYGHAEKACVKVGQLVKAGDKIGHAGFANAWHVHFMVNRGGTSKGIGDHDPLPYVLYAMAKGKR